MNILITGATGFIGRALTLHLKGLGHSITALSTNPETASRFLGNQAEILEAAISNEKLAEIMNTTQVVINLAGENLFNGRWNPPKKEQIRNSRVATTTKLITAIQACTEKPKILISASAVGYYDHNQKQELQEHSPAGSDFLAQVCHAWEEQAQKAAHQGVRVCILRMGLVLGSDGGAFAQFENLSRYGLGGRLGSGRQYMSWIHIDDLTKLVTHCIIQDHYEGIINACAPTPVTNAEFTKTLASYVHRPSLFPMPKFLLQLFLGEAANALLQSQQVSSQVLDALDFEFSYPNIASALKSLLPKHSTVTIMPLSKERKRRHYPATHILEQITQVTADINKVSAFFSNPVNIGMLTPYWLPFQPNRTNMTHLQDQETYMQTIRVGFKTFTWHAKIVQWQPPAKFTELQESGPFTFWLHKHKLIQKGTTIKIMDRVYYKPPYKLLGRILHTLWIKNLLWRIFNYRGNALKRRFPNNEEYK